MRRTPGLGVLLTDADLAGESMYNDDLASVVEELVSERHRGDRRWRAGGVRRWFQRANDRTQKRWRVWLLRDRSGSGQAQGAHLTCGPIDLRGGRARSPIPFRLGVRCIARKAGFLPDDVSAEHVAFGQVLGPDGKNSPLARERP